MCGISAIFSPKPINGLIGIISSMNDTIRHRGPDDEGMVLFSTDKATGIYGGVDTPERVFNSSYPWCPKSNRMESKPAIAALGHRRLSIIDLSPAGHQPMSSEDSSLWISYNGEVYNYIELRQELEGLGYRFKTKTDTEVVLKAFQEWGKKAFCRMNGMFAFVLYDSKNCRIYAVRDRFGIKPLYYWLSPSGFIAFASEIKQFATLPGWEAMVNGQAAYDFFKLGSNQP